MSMCVMNELRFQDFRVESYFKFCFIMLMAKGENGSDIFRPYSGPNPFRGV
jgi:hypothetical protein